MISPLRPTAKAPTAKALGFGLALLSMTAAPAAQAGTLVLTGGNWAYPGSDGSSEAYGVSIYEEIVSLAGGPVAAKVGIISTASDDPEESAGFYLEDFAALYGDAIDVEYIPITLRDCGGYKNDPGSTVVNQIRDRNAFIFTGGDQSYITDCFFNEDPAGATRTDTALIQALRQQFDAGAVIAGTSAGTAVQPSAPMITNGESYEGLRDGTFEFIGSPPFTNTVYYNTLGGLGFFDYGLLDSHFSERGRQGRIIRLAADLGVETAYGVDENTSLIVKNPGTDAVSFEVLGEGGVFISDLAQAEVGAKDGYWTISNVLAIYLTEGDTYNPLTKAATFAGKASLAGQESLSEVPTEANIFSDYDPELEDWTNQRALTEQIIDLVDSTAAEAFGVSLEDDPAYGVTLSKMLGTAGYVGPDSQGATRYSFENVRVDIAPTPEPGLVLGLLGMGLGLGLGARRGPSDRSD